MIISDHHEFAFIHIPKCAGTNVRNRLLPYDNLNGAHTERVEDHPVLGPTDFVHLPLYTLRDHFPAEFDKVQRYWSFAVLRDPKSRFFSAVAQRVRMYRGAVLRELSEDQIASEISAAIADLQDRQGRLPPDLIHFQRQVDYVMLDGRQVIGNLYMTSEVDRLLADLAARVGIETLPETDLMSVYAENRTMVYKNHALRVLIEKLRPSPGSPVLSLIPESVKKRIRSTVYTPSGNQFDTVAERIGVDDFIASYYADDLALVERVKAENRAKADA